MSIELRRGADRLESQADGVVSRHSFAFGPHYDPTNTRFGALVTHNDDVLSPGAGFPEHPHRDLEIVTWVVSGALRHADNTGASAIMRPGMVGRLSTGAGVRHSETNASSGETRYLQMWIMPDVEGLPSYSTADVSSTLERGEFVAVASGSQPAAVTLRCNATLFVARFAAGASATLPASALLHLFVARGSVTLTADGEHVQLLSEDAARLTGAIDVLVEATADAEILAWAMG
ncbi:MAG TPA: pirin family protein [Acidothermaceae bacterium]|nr:pirin family protein [Acidothermaceae bacterium]